MYVVMAGLPASGKSTIARILERRLSAVLLDKDAVRDFLFGQFTEYSREQDDLCMEMIYATAGYLVRQHPKLVVILDGRTYSRNYQVAAVKAAAANAGTATRFIECVCSESSARARLEQSHGHELHLAADRDFSLYQRSKASAEPITESRLIIDTDESTVEHCVQAALDFLAISP